MMSFLIPSEARWSSEARLCDELSDAVRGAMEFRGKTLLTFVIFDFSGQNPVSNRTFCAF